MTKEEISFIEEFLVGLADCTNKINYVAEQAMVMEEEPVRAVEIMKDYNDKIIALADDFNKWLIEKNN